MSGASKDRGCGAKFAAAPHRVPRTMMQDFFCRAMRDGPSRKAHSDRDHVEGDCQPRLRA